MTVFDKLIIQVGFARLEDNDCVISVENEEMDRCDIRKLVVDPLTNQSGLFGVLSTLAPNSTTINSTDSSYGGLIANASGRELDRGVLLINQYDRYFTHRVSDLDERTLRTLYSLLECSFARCINRRTPTPEMTG